jgi:hypothetical protein
MRCAHCGHRDSKVMDSRFQAGPQEAVWRRRECLSCAKRWTTYERNEAEIRRDVSVDLAVNLLRDLDRFLIDYDDDPQAMHLLRRARKILRRTE